jgi:hypothetical protein
MVQEQDEFLFMEPVPKRQRLDSVNSTYVDEQNLEHGKLGADLGDRYEHAMQCCSSLVDRPSNELAQDSTQSDLVCFGMVFHKAISTLSSLSLISLDGRCSDNTASA